MPTLRRDVIVADSIEGVLRATLELRDKSELEPASKSVAAFKRGTGAFAKSTTRVRAK